MIVPLLRNVDIEKKDCDKWEELRCPPGSNVPSLVEITALKLFVKCIVKDGLYFNDMFAYGIRPAESPKVLNHDGYDGEQQLLLFWSRLDDLQLRLDIPLSFDELFEQYEMTYRLSDIFAFHEQENQSKKKIEQEKPSLSLPATIAPNDQPKLEDVNPNSTTLTTSSLYQDALTMAHTLLLTDQTSRSGESGTIDTYYDNTEQDATAWGAESSVAEQSGSGVPSVPNVEPDLSWDPSEQETQPLTPSDMSSNDDLKAGSKRKSYYDLPKVGTPKNAKISYVKLVTPSSSTCRTSTSSDLAKQSSKMTYVQYLKECNVKNEKHYDHLIKTDPILAELELSTNVNSLKALKAIVLNQNTTEKPTLMADTLMTEPEPTEKEIRVFDRFFHALFTEIANNNNTDIMTFTKNLFHVLDLSDPKVSTIIFIGKANTGKTYLSNILRSYVPEYDLGIVQSVHGNPSDFWLQDLVGKALYICEELCLSTKDIIQRFKGVMEGNSSLDTNVKYSGNKQLYRRPFIVTMNGECREDVCVYFQEEFDAINARCHIYYMDKSLKDIAPPEVLSFVFERRRLALKYIRSKFDKYYKTQKCNQDIVIQEYIS